MHTPWIEERRLSRSLARHDAFWRGELEDGPLMWVTAPGAKPGRLIPPPADEQERWTDVDYVISSTDNSLQRTHYAGDALPVFCPWLGPDQFAGWLGAELTLEPGQNTSWSRPFVEDWDQWPDFRIDPDNSWWKLYLELLRESVRAGRGKWVTGYPDLHTGIDALAAIRGRERLAIDLIERPEAVLRAMRQMTALWEFVVDTVSEIVLPAGQGTTNWTVGWSPSRYLCIGQNDFTCMISPRMFDQFCRQDNAECCAHVDCSIYHLDGPGALRHVPSLLRLDRLNCIQWIQGAGQPLPSEWLGLLRQIQDGGKSVQVHYALRPEGDADLRYELDRLCQGLDPDRLFVWAETRSAEEAEAVVRYAARARGSRQ